MSAADAEAHDHWLAERPARPDPNWHDDASPYDWGFNAAEYRRVNGIPETPDPWARGQIQCERCEEYREPHCTHGRQLCAECARWCESCACEEDDAAAIIQQQRDEWWGRA